MHHARCTVESVKCTRHAPGVGAAGTEGQARGSARMARRRLPEKLYRIGEVMEHSGLSRQTLHLYTTMGLIREKQRTLAGYRLYPPTVFAALERVRALQEKGYTLAQIREALGRSDLRRTSRHDAAPHARTTNDEPQTPDKRPRTGPAPQHAFGGEAS
ncbi:MAG: helix-turn-helix domain-containing protein [Planctomycetaceae bacterium]